MESDVKPEAMSEGGIEPKSGIERVTECGKGEKAHQRVRKSGKSGPDHVAGAQERKME